MSKDSKDYTVTLNITTDDGPSTITTDTQSSFLDLSDSKITGIDLTSLSQCTSLNTLILFLNHLTCIDLTPLSACTSLRRLTLRVNRLTSIDLAPLSACTNLVELDLSINQFTSINLTPLSACTNLTNLILSGNRLQEIDLAPLSNCKNLKQIDLYDNELVELDLTPLAECTNLEEISLAFNQLKEIDLVPLSNLVNMIDLALGNNQLREIDLTPLSNCINLTVLYLSYNQLKEIDLEPLSKCTDLESFYLSDNPLPMIDLTPLYECKFLETFQFDRPIQLFVDSSTIQVDEAPSALKELMDEGLVIFGKETEKTTFLGKILLVGETGSGKSSLIWRMKNLTAPPVAQKPHYSTEGVEIHTLSLENGSLANIWDFGGQIEQTHIHQLFFTDHGLYLFVFRPDTWERIGFSRWFDMFSKRRQSGGYFVAVRSCLNIKENGHWTLLKRLLKDSFKTKSKELHPQTEMKDSIHPTIFEVDSLDGSGVAGLVAELPELMKKAGAVPFLNFDEWSKAWELFGKLKPKAKNDLGILTQEEFREALDGSFSSGVILDYLHYWGYLIFLPLVPLSIHSDVRIRIKKLVLLNAELAGRLASELHIFASENSGILRGKFLTRLEQEPLLLNIKESWSGIEETAEIQSDQVVAFLDFLKEGEIAIKYNRRWLFPFSVPIESSEILDLWGSYDTGLAVQLEWEENASFCRTLKNLLESLDIPLNPKAVWENGGLFEIGKNPKSLIRFGNITFGSHRTRNHKYYLQIRTSRIDPTKCSIHFENISRQLCVRAKKGEIYGLEPRMICPQCFKYLIYDDDNRYICHDNAHEYLEDAISKESKSCFNRIKEFLPSPRTSIDDLGYRHNRMSRHVLAGQDTILAGQARLSREHEEIIEHIDELRVLVDLMKKHDESESVIRQIEDSWKMIESELLEPMRYLLQRYQETLMRSDEFLNLSKRELTDTINELKIPEKEKKGIRGFLRSIPGALTVETLGNVLWTYGPMILRFLLRA